MNKYKPHPKQIEFFTRKEDKIYFGGASPSRTYTWIRNLFMEQYPRFNELARDFITIDIREVTRVKYKISEKMSKRIENDFTYHSPKDDQPERYVYIRDLAKALALTTIQETPESREQSLALTSLEEYVFWANAAIARNE